MQIARSLWRKLVVTAVTVGGFVLLYEATILDSRFGSHPPALLAPADDPAPGARMTFTATAYCKGLATSSGVAAQQGIAASDPQVLPVGSIVQVESGDGKYDGIYSVLDTGPGVQGRHLDLYIWNCNEALRFGQRPVLATVLRLGWDPAATTPTLMERFFRRVRRQPARQAPLPSRPLPIEPQ